MMNKKGITDAVLVIILLFCIAIIIFFGVFLSQQLKQKASPKFATIDRNASQAMDRVLDVGIKSADWIIFVFFIAMIVGIIITSFLFYAHPVFSVLWVFLSIGGIVLAVIFSNTYEQITTHPIFNETYQEFKMTNYIMSHLPLIFMVVFVLSMIIIYSKPQPAEGVQI